MKCVYSFQTCDEWKSRNSMSNLTLFSSEKKLINHLKNELINGTIKFDDDKIHSEFLKLKTNKIKRKFIEHIFENNKYNTIFMGADKLVIYCFCEELELN